MVQQWSSLTSHRRSGVDRRMAQQIEEEEEEGEEEEEEKAATSSISSRSGDPLGTFLQEIYHARPEEMSSNKKGRWREQEGPGNREVQAWREAFKIGWLSPDAELLAPADGSGMSAATSSTRLSPGAHLLSATEPPPRRYGSMLTLEEKCEQSFFLFYYYRMEDEAVLDRGASLLKHVCDEEEAEAFLFCFLSFGTNQLLAKQLIGRFECD
ncbi:Electrogenic sodium bicarbonate cotransporter 1 [Liparis tanakae]|uniref:Electrogenic sodium bicarbonate cotransporter 1 n=1 Tax=Liparis tanakae TaxID=230148 RepID=A0A4Z2GYI4_9TELE|nr:Electrogenic sodium bicarbonate cotransporter 1 [Liparis tanakae]